METFKKAKICWKIAVERDYQASMKGEFNTENLEVRTHYISCSPPLVQ
jgi:hypothetical protein